MTDAPANADTSVAPPEARRLSQTEFIALVAMLFATVAFSIDAMLPALGTIGRELSPDRPELSQLVITSFVLGMGTGTLITGPLSDAYGRRPVIVGGVVVYLSGTVLAWNAGSLEVLLAARVVQGLGAAAPRIVALAIIRDLYAGRGMAKIMSFVLTVFMLVPAIAPSMGAGLMALGTWRTVFAAFFAFALVSMSWLFLRQPETLPPSARVPFRAADLWRGFKETMSTRRVVISMLVQALAFGMLLSNLSAAQPIFAQTFGITTTFPFWFAGIAAVAATGSFINSRVVERTGMRAVILAALLGQIVIASAFLATGLTDVLPEALDFWAYYFWCASVFFMVPMSVGNINALAMEPMGHIAGLAASIIGAASTIMAVSLAVPVGLAFDGTPYPVAMGVLGYAVLAALLTAMIQKGA